MAKERIEVIVERLGNEVAAKLGYELIEVEYRKEGPYWVFAPFYRPLKTELELKCTFKRSS